MKLSTTSLLLCLSSAWTISARAVADGSCKRMAGDADFPTLEEMTAILPGVQPQEAPGRPDFHISVKDTAGVQAAVKAAAKYGLRISVLNSGHDYLGRNDAPTGLSLDISKLGGMKLADKFVPSESTDTGLPMDINEITPTGKWAALTFGPGVSSQTLSDAVSKSGLFVIGAGHGEVTVSGGWSQWGGHGPLSADYGLGVDQALEYKVVTPDGEVKVANAQTNPDLFWALRGGGGSTFGVVVESTIRAHLSPKVASSGWAILANDSSNPGDSYWNAVANLHRELPGLSQNGVQGYYYVYPSRVIGMWISSGDNATEETLKAITAPAMQRMTSMEAVTLEPSTYNQYDNYKSFFDDEWGPLGADEDKKRRWVPNTIRRLGKRDDPDSGMDMGMGGSGPAEANGRSQVDGRLLGARHFENKDLAALLKAALPNTPRGELRGNFVAGAGVHNPIDGADATSANPAWRSALTNIVASGQSGPWNASSLVVLAPDSGVYGNEASTTIPDWTQQYFGKNYDRLLSIKQKYDPDNVFWCTPCVGASFMKITNGRLCKLDSKMLTQVEDTRKMQEPPVTDNMNMNEYMEGNEGKSIKKWKPKGY